MTAMRTAPDAARVTTQTIAARRDRTHEGVSRSRDAADTFSIWDWSEWIDQTFHRTQDGSQHLVKLALAIVFLRQKFRMGQIIDPDALARIWTLVLQAFAGLSPQQLLPRPSRSAQGFLAVPLCSLLIDGRIDELFRLHVWLPDGQRGAPGFEIHSHQPFARSWVLAGEGKDHVYEVEPASEADRATHAKYALAWADGKESGTAYKTHQTYSRIVNTREYVHAHPGKAEVHTRGMSYAVPAASFHRTEVAPEFLHATLFYFDSSRGFVQTAPVLGPKDAESSTQLRDAAGIDALTLAGKVESVRAWEEVLEGARRLAGSGQWALALEAFSAALAMCCPHGSLPNATCYRHLTLSELSSVLHIPDERGRCALDHAVVTDDFEAEQMVLEARRLKLSPGDVESVIHQSIKDARLRKHYEELFQKSFLPALTASRDIDLHRIRRTYAETLATDTAKRRAFDNLKYVRYTDLVDFGRFPRSTDGLTQEYHVLEPGSRPATPILFFSHRWIHPDPWAQAPSAAEHTQYKRVLAAAAAFLTLHPKVEQADLSIWIDYACIDQEHPLSGIAALPMVLAQCDALISLVDEEYHGRAWCSVEVLMAQALQRVCGRRVWYEHVEQFGQTGEDAAADGLHAGLREGPKDVYTTLAGKRLRFEEDRSKVLFLERQIRLFLTTGPRAPGGEDV